MFQFSKANLARKKGKKHNDCPYEQRMLEEHFKLRPPELAEVAPAPTAPETPPPKARGRKPSTKHTIYTCR